MERALLKARRASAMSMQSLHSMRPETESKCVGTDTTWASVVSQATAKVRHWSVCCLLWRVTHLRPRRLTPPQTNALLDSLQAKDQEHSNDRQRTQELEGKVPSERSVQRLRSLSRVCSRGRSPSSPAPSRNSTSDALCWVLRSSHWSANWKRLKPS